jgi:hypothetical protein
MCFRAPRQSKTASTVPERSLCILFMLNRIRWIAISPRNSPLYAFATSSASKKDSIKHPWPLAHSIMNAAEQNYWYSSWRYKPSMTATNVLFLMAFCSQLYPLVTKRCSHSHVCNTNVTSPGMFFWAVTGFGLDAVDVSHHLPLACVGSTEQRVLDLLFG